MNDLRELYQAVILDHNRKPQNFGAMSSPTGQARGHNPLCGDELTVYIKLEGDAIVDVTFEGSGCAISQASASLMTGAIRNKTISEALELFESFHQLVTQEGTPNGKLGKLAVFSGVREFPMRVKCATLSWHTLQGALQSKRNAPTQVTTE